MIPRIIALTAIFTATSIAWMILGSTIVIRTNSSSSNLASRVASTWGGPLEQRAPKVVSEHQPPIGLDSSQINVEVDLDHRRKGLLWYNTYAASFRAAYKLTNALDSADVVEFRLLLPAKNAVYDDVQVKVGAVTVAPKNIEECILVNVPLGARQSTTVEVAYRTQGLNQWRYRFGESASQVRDFQLTMHTNFRAVDFPDNTLSPTSKRETAKGWDLEWKYRSLVSGFPIALEMPEKLQPGPLAGEISYFAPVSLFFFFFVMFLVTTLRNIDLHPMNYFFLAGAFFAFHLLLAYLVDHISIHVAFVVCSVVSLGLVVSYLRIVAGRQFALREAATAQLVYLVLFSYAFFFKGYTGLAVTIGAIATLFVAMQATARVNWAQRFAVKASAV